MMNSNSCYFIQILYKMNGTKENIKHKSMHSIPIIGVLAQEAHSIRHLYPNETISSYIAASYVKFIESAGGCVLPIMIGQTSEYYKDIINKTNGLLLPGGAALFSSKSGFAEAGQHLYNFALEANQKADYYPVWAICLGMELMIQASIKGKEIRSRCSHRKTSIPLILKKDYSLTRLFSKASCKLISILTNENVTANNHQYCFTDEDFRKYDLHKEWKILSTNFDDNQVEFVSSYEHIRYPFYGVQFHPEKNAFEFEEFEYTHSANSVLVAQYFGNFFVNECRQNYHNIEKELSSELIYNFCPRYSGIDGSIYEQIYLF